MKIWVCGAILFLSIPPRSDGFSQDDSRSFQVSMEYARFRGDSTRAYVELCYSFLEKQLTFVRDGETYRGEVLLDVKLTPEGQADPVQRRAWLAPHVVADTAALMDGKSLIGVVGFGVDPGKYSLKLVARDNNDRGRVDSIESPVEVKLFEDPDRVMVSDLELCSTIRQSDNRESIFYKNTLEVIPNPGGLYGVGMPIVFYYAEIYNLLRGIRSDKYTVRSTVYDAFGNEVISHERKKTRVNESSVEVGTVKVGSLKQGTYTLVLSVLDSAAQAATSSMKRFFVYNPASVQKEALSTAVDDVLATEYAMMDEAQLDLEFAQCRYIQSDAERVQYKALQGAEAKRKFLHGFWKKRDSNPSTAANEVKQEYFARLSYANENFRASFREGWKTDRGRVYILYGPPDEYDRHPSEVDSKPYEIWYYHNIQGGVEFVFVDRTGFHDYQLVHSTHRNELRDDNWREQVQPN